MRECSQNFEKINKIYLKTNYLPIKNNGENL